ncbi:MAG: hypothetical protein FIB04_07445 [Gammaproteobacteria bacterium]|nr:hypothetical protein [Gammaproteobacteria bacterium]
MSRTPTCALAAIAVIAAALLPGAVVAEPYLAVQQGYKCVACHVNPTGGGLRNDFGIVFAENVMPARGLPTDAPQWTGRVGDFVRLGADLRTSWSRTEVPDQPAQQGWNLDQTRVYLGVDVIPQKLMVLVDEALAPGNAELKEAYVRYGDVQEGWYAKAGRFYLPFGWRLQDNGAFVRQVTGINMSTPDEGIEVGLEEPDWSAQLDITNGIANAGSGSGYQVTGQAAWVNPRGRLGAAASFTQSDAGNRGVYGVFGGLRTGPVAWLAEGDYIRDAGFPEGSRSLIAALLEANWNFSKGQNLKLTGEYFDPDRTVAEDQKTRWSIVYEVTPLPFIQLRAGFRQYDGIPQNSLDNRRLMFIELHGFL